MTAAAWAALALAMLVIPAGRKVSGTSTSGETSSARWLLPVATAMSGVACLVVLGPVRGAMVAAVGCPVCWFGLRAALRRGASGAGRGVLDPAVPLVLDLAAAALRAGRPPGDALALAAPAAPASTAAAFARVAALLRLGAEPARAWQVFADDDALASVAAVAVRSASSGARLALAFERMAAELRDESRARAAARAERVGVLAMAPLGACFLPSFVVLGIVPVVVGMAHTVFTGLP